METVIQEPEVDVVGPGLSVEEQSEDLLQLRQVIEEDMPSLGWEWT